MFVMEVTAGIAANSTGLVADGLDMLADASAYAIALAAVGRGSRFKTNAATISGVLLLLLGLAVLAEVVQRFVSGEPPEGVWMIVLAAVALAVNATVFAPAQPPTARRNPYPCYVDFHSSRCGRQHRGDCVRHRSAGYRAALFRLGYRWSNRRVRNRGKKPQK